MKFKVYMRSFYISCILILCLSIGLVGIGKAYENTVKTGFGQEKSAIEIDDGTLRILDFEINFIKNDRCNNGHFFIKLRLFVFCNKL